MAVVRCAAPAWRLRVPLGIALPAVRGGEAVATRTGDTIIRRGDPVVVAIGGDGFAVETSGVADTDARTGERVRVKLRPDAAPIMGTAIEAGRVAAR